MQMMLPLCLTLAALLLPGMALAASALEVGPLDNTFGPSLPAVAMPPPAAEETLANTAFPLRLEKEGLLDLALLEWARLETTTHGPERALALQRMVAVLARTGREADARRWLAVLAADYPGLPVTPDVQADLARATQGPARFVALATLARDFPHHEASVKARWDDVWRQAWAHGTIRDAYGLPAAALLQTRLDALNTTAATHWNVAVAASVIPGLGHALTGDGAGAIVFLLGWAVFGLAFMAACRHRHYAYAFVWVFPFVGLWMSAPLSAAAKAETTATLARHAAMKHWTDVAPTYIPSR